MAFYIRPEHTRLGEDGKYSIVLAFENQSKTYKEQQIGQIAKDTIKNTAREKPKTSR